MKQVQGMVQGDKSGLLTRSSWMVFRKERSENHDPPGKEY
jgi:hypothetical protein